MRWPRGSLRTTTGNGIKRSLARQLSIGQQGQVLAMNGAPTLEPYALLELAGSQLCERLSIPVAYYRRLPPEMRATVVNFDLRRLSDHRFLLRGKATCLPNRSRTTCGRTASASASRGTTSLFCSAAGVARRCR